MSIRGEPPKLQRVERSARKAIVIGGLIAGTLDIGTVLVLTSLKNIPATRIFQGIAEAVLGPASQQGGFASAALGFLMHFGVASCWTAVFYLLSRKLPVLTRWPVPFGILYGALVFIVMYRVVIPLVPLVNSLYLTEFDRTLPRLTWRQLVIHLVCVGIPIALSVRAFGPPVSESRDAVLSTS